MASHNANAGVGDSGARQKLRSDKNVAAVHSQVKTLSQEPGREAQNRDRDLLELIDIDTSRLSAAEIKEAVELVRRISQCDRVPGAGKRRGPAIEALRAFRTAKAGRP